jgi:hypothetical protein
MLVRVAGNMGWAWEKRPGSFRMPVWYHHIRSSVVFQMLETTQLGDNIGENEAEWWDGVEGEG